MKGAKEGRKKHRGRRILLVVLAVIVFILGATVLAMEPGRREAMDLTISPVDFGQLQDGVYTGEYRGTKDKLRDTAVQVTVSEGAVTDIQVVEGALAGEKQDTEVRNGLTIRDLFGRVIEAQSLQVEAISGATITSKVNLKAVENALEQAQDNQ